MGKLANFIRTSIKKIKPNCLADLGKSRKAKKEFLKKLNCIKKKKNNENLLESLKANVCTFFNGLIRAVDSNGKTITLNDTKSTFFTSNTKNKKNYNINAFYLGNVIESQIGKDEEMSLEDWTKFLVSLVGAIDEVVKHKDKNKDEEKKQKESKTKDENSWIKIPDFMANNTIKNELKRVRGIFNDYKNDLSKVEEEEEKRLKEEFDNIFNSLDVVELSEDLSDFRDGSIKLLNDMQQMTFKKRKDLEEEKISSFYRYAESKIARGNRYEIIESVSSFFEAGVRIYQESDGYLLCQDFIEKEFFDKFRNRIKVITDKENTENQ